MLISLVMNALLGKVAVRLFAPATVSARKQIFCLTLTRPRHTLPSNWGSKKLKERLLDKFRKTMTDDATEKFLAPFRANVKEQVNSRFPKKKRNEKLVFRGILFDR